MIWRQHKTGLHTKPVRNTVPISKITPTKVKKVQNFEVVPERFNAVSMCFGGNRAQK